MDTCRLPMPPSASTGSRRRLLKAAGLVPGALLASERAAAADAAPAAAALRAICDQAAEVVARLQGLAARVAVRAFAESLLRDHTRHRAERDRVFALLGREAGSVPPPTAPADALDLGELKAAQEKLTYAMAEALPLLGRAEAVRTIAHQMVDSSRHLTLVGLWIEAEERRAS